MAVKDVRKAQALFDLFNEYGSILVVKLAGETDWLRMGMVDHWKVISAIPDAFWLGILRAGFPDGGQQYIHCFKIVRYQVVDDTELHMDTEEGNSFIVELIVENVDKEFPLWQQWQKWKTLNEDVIAFAENKAQQYFDEVSNGIHG